MIARHFLCICCVIAFWSVTDLARGGDWPQWFGPQRDGHAAPDSPALEKLPAEPKVVWRKKIGGGFSSPVVANGKLVFTDEDGRQEMAHLLDAKTGAEIWRTEIGDVYQDERSTYTAQ